MRTFLLLYSSDFKTDDDKCPCKSGKSRSSERQAFAVLCSVCWNWRHTMSGWPESRTRHWLKHRLRKLIERECVDLVSLLLLKLQ